MTLSVTSPQDRVVPLGADVQEPRPRPHPRVLGWFGTTALAMGGSNQSLFLIAALFTGQGSAAVPLLGIGVLLSCCAAPGWIELVLMSPDRVGGIAAACTDAFRRYSSILSALTGVSYWWGWVPACGITAIISATAISQWCLPGVPVNLIACTLIALFTIVNLLGVRWVATLAVPVAVVSASLAFVSVLAPVAGGQVDWRRAVDFHLAVPFGGWFGQLTSLMAGLYLVGFGAPAFEAALCHVGETRDPIRNIPRAVAASAVMAALYFVALPVVWLGALGPESLGEDLAHVLGPTFAPVFGGFAKAAAVGFMMFNMFHGTLQPLAGAARTLSQLSDDGLAPRFLAWRLATDAPWAATLVTAGVATAFLLFGDPIWLVAAANFTYLIGFCLPSIAVWLLRRDAPDAPRPFRAPRGTIGLGIAAAGAWACSALFGYQQFGLKPVIIGLLLAYSGAGLYAWRKLEERRRRGLPWLRNSLHLKLTGAMLLVLGLDTAGYMLAIDAVPKTNQAFISALEDIFVAVAFLTISVGIVLPGIIGHSATQVSDAARRLALGTVKDFADAMDALGQGRLEAAHASIDVSPVAVRSSDELGMMAESFNILQEGVVHAAVGLRDAREGLSAARQEILDANVALAATVGIQERLAVELMRAKEAAVHEALHDPLTGLPNRTLFISKLDQALERRRRGAARQFAVLFIDLDRFKMVNDSLGHVAGNELIVQVADRLVSLLRPEAHGTVDASANSLTRLGGDEFAALLPDIASSDDAQTVAAQIQGALLSPFVIKDQDIYCSASVGIALSSDGHVMSADILRDADLAMQRAKSLGKARAETYDASLHALATSRLMLESDLRRALRNAEFLLHYQPIVLLQTSTIIGFEALVRWQSPERGLVNPATFIAVAEDAGLIVPLGLWIIEDACLQAAIWQRSLPDRTTRVSINISPRQFAQEDLVQQVMTILARTGVDPDRIHLEITESSMMEDPDRAARVLSQFRAMGLHLAIDDFGTGYSSLSYLQRLPLDVLKIDRSFVAGLPHNEESRQIVTTIMALAAGLRMDVVAEGIEDGDQAAEMVRLGCRFGQGFLFSKPVVAAEATALLSQVPTLDRSGAAAA